MAKAVGFRVEEPTVVGENKEKQMPNDTNTSRLKALDEGTNQTSRVNALQQLQKIQFTPIEGQVAFIKELVKLPAEAKKFLDNPKQYSIDHGVLIDPAIVQKVVAQTLFDVALDPEFANAAGPYVVKDIVDLRDRLGPGGIKPVIGPGGDPVSPTANIVAAAAVVVAVAAVVTAVVTVVRTKRPEDLISLQSLGGRGTLLPNNTMFIDRTGIRNISGIQNLSRTVIR